MRIKYSNGKCMSYLTTLVTVVLGILGVLFSKHGERAPITPIGYMIIGLIFLSGLLTAVDTSKKAYSSANERRQLTAENDLIRADLTKLRLATYDLGAPPRNMLFILDYMWGGEPLEHKDFSGPFAAFGSNGDIGFIWIQIPDLVVIHGVIEARGRQSFVRLPESNRESDPWFTEEFAPAYAVGANMTEAIGRNSARQLLSKMTIYHRLGLILLNRPNDIIRVQEALAELHKVSAYFKLYVPLRLVDADSCVSVIYMPLRFVIPPPNEETKDKILIEIYRQGESLKVVDCEEIPF